MTSEFTAVIERDGEWFIGYCPEIPGANGQGKSGSSGDISESASFVNVSFSRHLL